MVDARGRKGDLALLWERDSIVEVKSYSSHHIEVSILERASPPWRFVGFYGHHETNKRKFFWNIMTLVNGLSNVPTLFIGDFNEVLSDDEHVSLRSPRPRWQI
ncbi:hypothetical protein LIER_10557 [Lithospermum erythrorhizon]|uniref:Endonuclease/exonuclease/phosphatase family protein n=1 Tax=Lithospermum erythrorhizon TaxID=34254 RepID=A0AAV3PMK4_LITER